jgi:rare lipoprotein A
VRVNDRGPFHSERIIDLSYTAAYKLGYVQGGSALLEVESILPQEALLQSASAAPAPTQVAQVAEPKPIYVQLGAFSSKENAEDLRSRLARQLTWLTDSVQVLASGALWRLHVGPYRSNDAARSVAERIEAELNLKPLLVVR